MSNLLAGAMISPTIAAVLSVYGARTSGATARELGEGGGFSQAQVWRVATPSGENFALRCTPADSLDRSRVEGLHRLLTWVHGRGVTQVPVPLAAGHGGTLVSRGEAWWQLEPWMPGEPGTNGSPVRLAAAMHCLARFHLAAATFDAAGPEVKWYFTGFAPSRGLAERLGHIARWNTAECLALRGLAEKCDWKPLRPLAREILDLYEHAAPAVAARLRLGSETPVPLQPCLRDVWHDHVLFTGDVVTGLIDAHACRSDTIATDLARLLGSLVGDDRQAWETALQAYQELRPLAINERGLIELFDSSGTLLNGMTWLHSCLRLKHRFSHPQRILDRLDQILKRLRHLADRV